MIRTTRMWRSPWHVPVACAVSLLAATACGDDEKGDDNSSYTAPTRAGERDSYSECVDWYRQTEECCVPSERLNDAGEWCAQVLQGRSDPWYYDSNQCLNFVGFCAAWGFCDTPNPQRVESSTQTYSACMAARGQEP